MGKSNELVDDKEEVLFQVKPKLKSVEENYRNLKDDADNLKKGNKKGFFVVKL